LNARAKYQATRCFLPGGEVQGDRGREFRTDPRGELLTRSWIRRFCTASRAIRLLTLARDLGYKVSERVFDVNEMFEWVKTAKRRCRGRPPYSPA